MIPRSEGYTSLDPSGEIATTRPPQRTLIRTGIEKGVTGGETFVADRNSDQLTSPVRKTAAKAAAPPQGGRFPSRRRGPSRSPHNVLSRSLSPDSPSTVPEPSHLRLRTNGAFQLNDRLR